MQNKKEVPKGGGGKVIHPWKDILLKLGVRGRAEEGKFCRGKDGDGL